jgi:hypothetical protein
MPENLTEEVRQAGSGPERAANAEEVSDEEKAAPSQLPRQFFDEMRERGGVLGRARIVLPQTVFYRIYGYDC